MTDASDADPDKKLSMLMDGFRLSQCIHVIATLGVADALDNEQTTARLAQAVKADEDALRRLLRAVSSMGLFARAGEDTWKHTALSRLLRSDGPGFADRARALGDLAWASWGALAHTVRTGETAFDHVHGKPFFAWLQEHPEQAASFGRTMTSFTRMTAENVASAHDFSAYRRVTDVGGGHGVLLDVLLARNPDLRATLLDRAEVVSAGAPALRSEVRDRCALVGGDFFAEIPAGSDAYLMSWILHDWDDETCIRLLRACREAMTSTTDLLVVEMLVADDDAPSMAKMFDLEMMVQTGGRERTEAEYRRLFETAGLDLASVVPTAGPHAVMVVRRAEQA